MSSARLARLSWLVAIAGFLAVPAGVFAAASVEVVGTKEVVIDKLDEFRHTPSTNVTTFKNSDAALDKTLFDGTAEISDTALRVVEMAEISEYLAEIKTTNLNTLSPLSPGLLRLAGWNRTYGLDTAMNQNANSDDKTEGTDTYNQWSTQSPDATNATSGAAIPVGGLDYLLQSFKVAKNCVMSKIRLKVRRHPGRTRGSGPGLNVLVIPDDGAGNPQQSSPGNDVVIGWAKAADSAVAADDKVGPDSADDGATGFATVEFKFDGDKQPWLKKDTTYWLKVTSLPVSR